MEGWSESLGALLDAMAQGGIVMDGGEQMAAWRGCGEEKGSEGGGHTIVFVHGGTAQGQTMSGSGMSECGVAGVDAGDVRMCRQSTP